MADDPASFSVNGSRAKTTRHGLNPIDTHIRATHRRFTPRAAQANPTRDHFAQRSRRSEVIANYMNVNRGGTFADMNAAAGDAA